MKRRKAVLLSLFAVGCSKRQESEARLPESLPGGWRLQGNSPETEIPPFVSTIGYESATRYRYQGPGELIVSVYTTKTSSSAFELVQKWRPEPGKLAFHKGPRFVVISWAGSDNTTLNAVAKPLEDALPH